ncbi:MAG: hypothetical protein M0T77_15025 [Actinomycetota bacterium]|nr:hypothetical protein [Actinomycetota bacterium]
MNPLLGQPIPGAEFRWPHGVAQVPQVEADEATFTAISDFIDSIQAPSDARA